MCATSTVAEERRRTAARAVDELVRDHHVQRLDVLAQAADGADGDDELDAELLEGPDVRAGGHLGWKKAVPDAVPRQERDALAVQRADGDGVAGRAVRCVDPQLLDVGEAVHLVEAAAADNSGAYGLALATRGCLRCADAPQAFSVRSPRNAILRDDGGDVSVRRHIEGRVLGADASVRGQALPAHRA